MASGHSSSSLDAEDLLPCGSHSSPSVSPKPKRKRLTHPEVDEFLDYFSDQKEHFGNSDPGTESEIEFELSSDSDDESYSDEDADELEDEIKDEVGDEGEIDDVGEVEGDVGICRGRQPLPQQVTWDSVKDFEPRSYMFDSVESGMSDECNLAEDSSELEYFQLYLDEELMSHVVSETNRYHKFVNKSMKSEEFSDMCHWQDTTLEELYTFLGLILAMPLQQIVKFCYYWNEDSLMCSTPLFKKVMSWDRFQLLMHFLHFSDNDSLDESDRLWKIRPVLSMLNDRFKSHFRPYQNLAIGESSILFRELDVFKPKRPPKRHRFDTKVLMMCDCLTHMVLSVNVSIGKYTDDPSAGPRGPSGDVVKRMMEGYLDKGHILFTDEECTSPDLCDYLHKNGTGSCGSVKRRCLDMSKFGGKLKSGESELFKKDNILAIIWADNDGFCEWLRRDKVMAYRWKGKGEVRMLSTVHKGAMVDSGEVDRKNRVIMKPDVVMDYGKNMPQKEKYDLQISYMVCYRRSVKWYKKLFFHLVDVAMLNACNLFRHKTGKKISLLVFIEAVVRQLLIKYSILTEADLKKNSGTSDDELGGSSEFDSGTDASDSDTDASESDVGASDEEQVDRDRSVHSG